MSEPIEKAENTARVAPMKKTAGVRHENRGLRKRCDCPRRSWPKCPHSWWLNFKHGEKHNRISLDKHLGRHIDRKTDAEDEAAEIKKAIKDGRFGLPEPLKEVTYRQLAKLYLEDVEERRPVGLREARYASDMVCRTEIPLANGKTAEFGDLRLDDITTYTVETFRKMRRKAGTGIVGVNRHLRMVRQTYKWGIINRLTDRTPFKLNGETVVKLAKEHARSRRLDADKNEREKLLAACSPHLRSVVEAALETGCRKGEILSLQWSQVEGMVLDDQNNVSWAARAEIVLPWAKTKTRTDRRIPISSRLRAILTMRRFDPAGQSFRAADYVFGNEVGQRISDVGRAWESAVLKAHGFKAAYTGTKNLTNECRAQLASINLHFHDLRREAGSRWLEGGVQLHVIQSWLGHTKLSQTSTYLACTTQGQHEAMKQFEESLACVQRRATEAETGGRKSPPAATTPDEKLNETKEDRQTTIM